MKRFVVIFAVLIIIAAALGLLYERLRPKLEDRTVKNAGPHVCLDSQCYGVELARTPDELMRGLMFRTSLPQNAGMFFVFDSELDQPFWMKNTLIPLDMVWISGDYRVVYIKHSALPCQSDPCEQIDPRVPARYVLEVNSREMDRIQAKIGDQVTVSSIP